MLGPLTGRGDSVGSVWVAELQGRPVIVSVSRGTVLVWDLATGHEQAYHPSRRSRVGVVAAGKRQGRPVIVTGGDDGTVRVWDLESGELVLGPLTGHHDSVGEVRAAELQGRPVIVSSSGVTMLERGRAVLVWDLVTGRELARLTGYYGRVLSVAVTELQGRPVIVTSGSDGTARVWDLESGESAPSPLTGHKSGVTTVAVGVRHGRSVIISGGLDRTVRVWDLEAERSSTLRIELQHRVLSIASTAGRLVIGTTAELLRVDLL